MQIEETTKPKRRKMRQDLIKERNKKIRKEYYDTFGMMTVQELALKYNMTTQNLYRILKEEEK